MRGRCRTFEPRDLVNSGNLTFLQRLSSMLEDLHREWSWPFLLVEDVGEWMDQGAWTDSTGFFVTFRIAPLDVHKPRAQEGAEHFIQRIRSEIGNGGYEDVINFEAIDDASGKKVTVIVETLSYSIGD